MMKPSCNCIFKTLCLSLFVCFSHALSAADGKFRLTGEVVDSATGKGIGFATVVLADSSAKPVAAWACDGNGRFDHTVKTGGKFTLSATSLGYATAQRPVELTAALTRIDKVQLEVGVNKIQEVAVTTTKPLIKSDIDKLSYSVEADPEASASTVLDILRKVPLVTVDSEDNVQLQGQSNYKVLVNGKSSSLMDKSFKEVVRGMPANSIRDIEVITSPSSKYEAEGVGGIINIITNRKTLSGYIGSVGISGDTFGGVSGNGYLNAKFGKFSISTSVNAGQNKRPGSESSSHQENKLQDDYRYVDSEGESKDNTNTNYHFQVEASYEIDTFNLISLSAWGYGGGYKYGNNSLNSTYDAARELVRQFRINSRGDGNYGNMSGNIDYQRTFPKAGKTLTFSYKLDNSPLDSETTQEVDGILDYITYQQRANRDTWSREHTFQIDFVNPLTEKHTVEAGTKFILRQNGSDPETYERTASSDPWVLNPQRRNSLDYNQYIWGLYGAYAYKFSKKFSGKAGARLETTWNDGEFVLYDFRSSADQAVPFDNRQFNVIPYINFSYAPKPANRYNASYTQRLARPSIWYMNPYVNDTDPMNISFGNPKLDCEVSHTFSASYGSFSQKMNFNLSANVTITNNSIEQVTGIAPDFHPAGTPDIVPDGAQISTYLNVGKRNRYALNAYYSWRPNGKFSINLNASGNYMTVKGKENSNEGFGCNGNLTGRISVWKEGTFNVNGYYSSPRIMLQGRSSGYYYYGMSLSQKVFKKKITANLSIQNPFNKTKNWWSQYDTPTFYSRSESFNYIRQARLNITYNFGKTQVQVKKARRGISNDDVKAGESGGDAGR